MFEIARVEEVIGEFLSLKKSGSNFKGLSPFSQERTPSFMVSPVKQIWKDFSSGKGGNVVAFLMEHEHFTYPEAIKFLANKYNIEIEETEVTDKDRENRDHLESLYLQNNFAQKHFSKNIWETTEGKSIGLSYFKERGFSEEIISLFGLGYALEKKDDLFITAQKEGYSDQFLDETGLVIYSDRGPVDRFRGRIIFPIKSMAGRIQGFGGRILSSKAKTAKYLNSPESKIYNKSKILYGIYEAKKEIAKEDTCYLVEGYTDVIQMYQKGIKNVVSSSGTALTIEQIQLIRRLTSNIIVLFDGDAAGLRAALRGIDIILSEGLNVKICSFPEGEDPDSFVKKNKKDFMLDYINNESKDFVDFKLSINNDFHNDEDKKVGLIKDILRSITLIPDSLKQEIYIKKLSSVLEIDEASLFRSFANIETNKSLTKSSRKLYKTKISKVQSSPKENTSSYIYQLERQIISILLKYGAEEISYEDSRLSRDDKGENITTKKENTSKVFEKIYLDLQEDEIEFTHSPFKAIYNKLIQGFHNQSSLSIENFINDLDSSSSKIVSDILINDEKYQLHDWERKNIYVKKIGSELSQLVNETILNMRRFLIDKKIIELQEFQKEGGENDILEEVMSYYRLKKVLSAKLNRVV